MAILSVRGQKSRCLHFVKISNFHDAVERKFLQLLFSLSFFKVTTLRTSHNYAIFHFLLFPLDKLRIFLNLFFAIHCESQIL